jgi:hypothetical protein
MIFKKCTCCQQEFPATLDYFNKGTLYKDGLSYICKNCASLKHREYYLKHKEQIKDHVKKYKENNKEKILNTYRSKYKIYNYRYRKNIKTKDIKKFFIYTSLLEFKHRKINLLSSKDEIYLKLKNINNCYICNCKLTFYDKEHKFTNATIHNLQQEKYTSIDGLELLCYKCNMSKSNLSMDHLLDKALKIYTRKNYIYYLLHTINILDIELHKTLPNKFKKLNRTINDSLSSHKRNGYTVNISTHKLIDYIITLNYKCIYCGEDLNLFGKISEPNKLNVDRLNNEQHMDNSNTVVCCRTCNTLKQDRTLEEFFDYCKLIIERFT